MTAATGRKKSIRIDDLSRAPIIGSRRLKPGLRGIACVALSGFQAHGGETVTHVYPKSGPPYDDKDSEVDIDHYVTGWQR